MTGYSHLSSATAFEPTEGYPYLREQCPLHRVDEHDPPFYVISRFDDVVDTLKQHALWNNHAGGGVFFQESGVLGTADEPDHSRQRKVLRDAFLPTVIARLEPRVRVVVAELLDEMAPTGEADFVEEFAAPFPALVIAELLGVDPALRHEFRALSDDAVSALSGGDIDAYSAAKSRLQEHMQIGIEARDAMLRAAGVPVDEVGEHLIGDVLPDDVLSRLAVGRASGDVSLDEAKYLGYQLLVAGHETTTSLLGLMMYRLLQHPEAMAAVRADRSLLPGAIEEALRFDSPVHGLFRTNSAPACIHGVDLPAPTKLQVLYASANRDPSRFTDPDTFDITRDSHELGRHVAFGWGIHHCIGAPLARMETRVALDMLFDRLDAIELAGTPVRNESFVLHGLTALPLRWTPIATTSHTSPNPHPLNGATQ